MSCRKSSEHQADHSKADKGDDGACIALEVACQAAIATDPRQGSLHDPSLGDDSELVQLGSFDDFDDPAARVGRSVHHPWSTISCIGEDALYEREQSPRAWVENKRRTVAILNVCRVNRHAQQEAKRVDEDVPLAAFDLLTRVVA